MTRSLCMVALGLVLAGCANYWSARRSDTADLLTLTGTTGFGAKAQAGPVQIAPGAVLVDVGGLRGGEWFATDFSDENAILPMDVGALWWSSSVLALPDNPRMAARGKTYAAFPAGATNEQLFARHTATVPFVTLPRESWAEEKVSLERVSPAYAGQVEFSVALAAGVRVGTNLLEWADFAVGWFGLDLLDDDHPTPK